VLIQAVVDEKGTFVGFIKGRSRHSILKRARWRNVRPYGKLLELSYIRAGGGQ